jgi:hypothetical protein
MNNSNDKSETETIKLKTVPIEKYHIDKNYKLCQVITILINLKNNNLMNENYEN